MSKLTLQQAIEQALPKLREKRQRDMEAALKNADTEDAHAAMREVVEANRAVKVRERQSRNEEEFRKSEFRADVEKFRMLTGSTEDSPLFWAAFGCWCVKRGLCYAPKEAGSECALMNGFEDGDDDLGGW